MTKRSVHYVVLSVLRCIRIDKMQGIKGEDDRCLLP